MNERLVHVGGMWCPAADPYFLPRLQAGNGLPWDGPAMQAAFDRVTDWRCALDVGAHIGTWTRQLAARFKSVVAFEPDVLNFEALRSNMRDVGNTRLLPLAVSPYVGRFSLSHAGTVNSGQGYLTPLQDVEQWVVGIPIDALALSAVDFIKLDVEGLECEVIGGAEKTIRQSKPVISLEENICATRYQHKPGDARAILEGWGMREAARFEFAHDNFDVIMDWRLES